MAAVRLRTLQAHLTAFLAALLMTVPATGNDNPFTSDQFQSEMAAISWNALVGLVEANGGSPTGRAARPKTDLTAYLSFVPTPGAVRYFESSAGEILRSEIVAVEPTKKGYRVFTATTVDGSPFATTSGTLTPGKKTRLESEHVDGLEIDLKKPLTTRWHRAVQGKPYRMRASGRANVDGIQVKARYKGTWTFVGFEDVQTPGGGYENTALIVASVKLTLKKGRVSIKLISDTTSWYTRDEGVVATTERGRIENRGEVVEDLGTIDIWRIDDPGP